MAAFFSDLPLFSLFSLFVFLLSLFKWLHASSKLQKKLPPSPPKLPIIGNLHQLGLLPHRSLHLLSKKYGPLMLLRLGSKSILIASSAAAAHEIMKTHDLICSNRPKSSIPDRLFCGSKDIAFSPYGEYWRRMKSISVLHLLSNKRVQSFHHIREEETSLMVEKISGMCSSNSAVNLSDIFVTLTNDVLCRVAFGRKYSEDIVGKKVMENLKVFAELLGIFYIGDNIPWLTWVNRFNGLDAKVEKSVHQNDRFLEAVIEEHMERPKREAKSDDETIKARNSDFVDIVLEIQKEDLAGFTLQRDAIKALILDMFAAGTDTTHSVMEWAMSELLRHPKILQKLKFEVREISQGNGENAFTQNVLGKMPYLKAVIKETLRLHSPVALLVPRESTQDIKLLGYDISAGTQIFVNAWAIGRDPMLWENPEEFQPERFLDSNIDFRGLNFEFIPFGAGRRSCPGINFAISLEELTLAKLVNKFNFSLPNGMRPEDLDMTEASGVTVHRKVPLLAIATPYSQ